MQKLVALINWSARSRRDDTPKQATSLSTREIYQTQNIQNADTRPMHRFGNHRLSEIQKTIDLSG